LFAVKASVDGLTDYMRKVKKQEDAYRKGVITYQLTGSGITGASPTADLVIDLGGPMTQRQWEVRALAVSYVNPETATQTGKAYCFYCPSAPTAGALSAGSGYFNGPLNLPAPEFYSTGQVVIRHPNKLWVVIVGGAATTQYVVNGSAQESADQYVGLTEEL
jgi:hypothetical protein